MERSARHMTEKKERVIYFGWPARGGVMVLNTTKEDVRIRGLGGMISVCATMEERCELLEKLGAVYFPNAEDCPSLDLSGKMAQEAGRKRSPEWVKECGL